MFKIQRKFVESCLLILLLLTLFLLASLSATAQESTNSQVQDKVARKATVEETDRTLPMSAKTPGCWLTNLQTYQRNQPYHDWRGVQSF